jgi:hypothetical protein
MFDISEYRERDSGSKATIFLRLRDSSFRRILECRGTGLPMRQVFVGVALKTLSGLIPTILLRIFPRRHPGELASEF